VRLCGFVEELDHEATQTRSEALKDAQTIEAFGERAHRGEFGVWKQLNRLVYRAAVASVERGGRPWKKLLDERAHVDTLHLFPQ
jgi:hypothetical protein